VVEAALSKKKLRPRLVVVWVLLLAMVGVIVAIERADRQAEQTADHSESRERMLIPVPVEAFGAIELAHAGTLHRFERDATGSWFYHGIHTASQASHAHQADPAAAKRIGEALAGLGRARVERQFDVDPRVNNYGLASPELLILVYLPKETQPLIQYAVGDLAPDQLSRYVQAVGSASVVMIANYQVDNLLGLIQAVSGQADQASAAKAPPEQ
jgi:hypothetical protein